jgi:hypothetical protein
MVDIGRPEVGSSIAGNIGEAKIVGQQENNVGRFRRPRYSVKVPERQGNHARGGAAEQVATGDGMDIVGSESAAGSQGHGWPNYSLSRAARFFGRRLAAEVKHLPWPALFGGDIRVRPDAFETNNTKSVIVGWFSP